MPTWAGCRSSLTCEGYPAGSAKAQANQVSSGSDAALSQICKAFAGGQFIPRTTFQVWGRQALKTLELPWGH